MIKRNTITFLFVAAVIRLSAQIEVGSDGNVGVRGSAGAAAIAIYATARSPGTFYNDNYYYTSFIANAATSSITGIAFGTRDSGGSLKVGYVSQIPDGTLSLLTLSTPALSVSPTQMIQFYAYGAGTLTTDSSGHITATSDARAKDTIGDFTTGLAAIRLLQPKKFHWKKSTGLNPDDLNVSVYAQDLIAAGLPEAVATQRTVEETELVERTVLLDEQGKELDPKQDIPAEVRAKTNPQTITVAVPKRTAAGEAITKKVDASYYTVSDRAVIAALINAAKELAAKNDALEARVAALEAAANLHR